MNKKWMMGMISLGCLIACDNQIEEDPVLENLAKVPLEVNVVANSVEESGTKAMVSGTALPNGSNIGLRVVDSGNSTYNGVSYNNKKYSYNGSAWSTTNKLYLSTTSANIYAYYPYQDGTDMTTIPLDPASGNDYMYSASSTASISSPQVTLNMKHALAQVEITLQKGSYTGTGSVTALTWSSASAGTGGTLNAIARTVTASGAGTSFNSTISSSAPQSISTRSTHNFIVVPSGSAAAPTFNVTMDGKTFTVNGASVNFVGGTKYTYTLQMDGKALTVSNVTVTNWASSSQGTLTPQ